jgi:Raf kinase inhibitor-like YbhB/YbcL family protein
LEISGVPADAQSLALIVHDPDAPVTGGWTHWIIFDLDPYLTRIAENSVPDNGIEALTSFRKAGYGGPCPPIGAHHYQFQLYALDTKLELEGPVTKEDIEAAIEGHVQEKALLVGRYAH